MSMLIANPIYDVVFKRMMENERVAKFFIGTLLDQQIVSIEVMPQEFTYSNSPIGVSIFRLDFIVTIKTADNEYKKVLIEIQKVRNLVDLVRFRNYLGEQYKKEDRVENKKTVLPITTIYVLGFSLPEIEAACLKVERTYIDLVNKTIIDKKSDFVEKLTHDCYVVQVNKITDRYQTRLDKLLSVFEQSNFTDDSKITKTFSHDTDIEEVKLMTDILHHSGTNPEEKKELENEQEGWRTINAYVGEYQIKLEEKLIDIAKKEREITEKEKEITEKDKEITEKDRLIEELKKKLNDLNNTND